MPRTIVCLLLSLQLCLLLGPLACPANSASVDGRPCAEWPLDLQELMEEDEKSDLAPTAEGGPNHILLCCCPWANAVLPTGEAEPALPVCYQADVPIPPPLQLDVASL